MKNTFDRELPPGWKCIGITVWKADNLETEYLISTQILDSPLNARILRIPSTLTLPPLERVER